jgi:glutaredoxin 3
MNRFFACLFCLLLAMPFVSAAPAGEQPADFQTSIGKVPPAQNTPLVIIYTLSDCPHCRAAKEYFTGNNIPFVTREVDTDSQHMNELMQIYDTMKVPDQKRGVPLILIGDSIKLQGFNQEKVQEAMKKFLQR